MRSAPMLVVLVGVLSKAGLAVDAEWLSARGDVQAAGRRWFGERVPAVTAWEFRPSAEVWEYQPDVPVWSSPAVAEVDGRLTLYVGSYDHNVYAVEALTGCELWRYPTGGSVEGAPAVARVQGRWMVFVGASDRTCYALDAVRGRKVWAREILAWRSTVGRAKLAAPAVFDLEGRRAVMFSYWVYDKSLSGGIEEGGVKCFSANDGDLLWSAAFSKGQPGAPLVVQTNDGLRAFIGSRDGNLYCLDAATGERIWRVAMRGPIASSPALAPSATGDVVLVGDRYGEVRAVRVADGELVWRRKVGKWIDSTVAVEQVGGKWLAFFGSQDQAIYAVDTATGEVRWLFETRGDVYSSPAVFEERGRKVVAAVSGDDFLYLLDASTGEEIWRVSPGRFLWDYRILGGAVWASPIAVGGRGGWLIIVPFYDGAIHAYPAQLPRAGGPVGSLAYALIMLRNVTVTALLTAVLAGGLIWRRR